MLKLNRTVLWTLVLAAGAAFPNSARAQRDRPIIISGGSPLIVEQRNGSPLTLVDDRLLSAYPNNVVTSVEVKQGRWFPHRVQLLPFRSEQCHIQIAFGDVQLEVRTTPDGRNLTIVALGQTNFKKDFQPRAGRFEHRPPPGQQPAFRIDGIAKGEAAQTLKPVKGHIAVWIHNEGSPVRN